MTSEDRKISFNQPMLHGSELEYIRETIEAMHTAGDGPFTKKCVDLLRQELGSAGVTLTTSCTDALEMSALLLDIRQGDEVIVPSFTFVSSVNSFVMRGAKPVFCDIRPDTLNIDETLIESLISPRTKALVLVHYGGVGCEMDAILEIAERKGIAVVEDNAHGLFSRYRGRYLGTFGCLSTNSFHETKNIMCGEGGALIINDPSLVERAEIIRDKGTNRQQLFRGEVDKYTWVTLARVMCFPTSSRHFFMRNSKRAKRSRNAGENYGMTMTHSCASGHTRAASPRRRCLRTASRAIMSTT